MTHIEWALESDRNILDLDGFEEIFEWVCDDYRRQLRHGNIQAIAVFASIAVDIAEKKRSDSIVCHNTIYLSLHCACGGHAINVNDSHRRWKDFDSFDFVDTRPPPSTDWPMQLS